MDSASHGSGNWRGEEMLQVFAWSSGAGPSGDIVSNLSNGPNFRP